MWPRSTYPDKSADFLATVSLPAPSMAAFAVTVGLPVGVGTTTAG